MCSPSPKPLVLRLSPRVKISDSIMKLSEISQKLQALAPLELAADWDNVGLLVGNPDQAIKRVMLAIDMTQAVFEEAQKNKTDLLLTYHPPVFEPMKKIVSGQGVTPLLHDAIRSNMAIYTVHTALDSVKGGVNDVLADAIGLTETKPLQSSGFESEKMCKLVVFLPESDLAKVSEAIFAAGAGHVGNYDKCSFRCSGTGTFRGGEGTNPTVGKTGQFEEAGEFRLETIVPVVALSAVVSAMINAHSYEEVAYDVIPLLYGQTDVGFGRVGDFSQAISKKTLIEQIKKTFKQSVVGLIGSVSGRAKRGAVCAGSCGSMLKHVIRQGCDFYLTGELKHHDALKLQEAGVTTVCLSHTNSERIVLPEIVKRLKPDCPGVEFKISRKDKDPLNWG